MFNYINFLNLPAKAVKKSKADYNNLYKLFVTEDVERLNFEEKAVSALFSGDFKTYDELTKGKRVHLDKYFIDLLINAFGSNNLDLCETILDMINNSNLTTIKQAKIIDNIIVIKTIKGKLKFSRFSDTKMEILKILPNLNIKQNREKQCHNLSIKFVLNSDINCKIATGYISSFAKEAKFLHSWVEMNLNNKPIVIDLTKNLITDKKSYYFVENISTPVYKISQSTLQKERQLFNSIARYSGPLSKLYLANRHQAISLYNQQIQQTQEK